MTVTENRPELRLFAVDDLLAEMQQGKIGLPKIQRPFRWEAEHVEAFFDSLIRGYPIGALVFWEPDPSLSEKQLDPLGPGTEANSARWMVIDGQQRMISLARVLLWKDSDPRFSLFYDLATEAIVRPNVGEVPGPSWLPLWASIDTVVLLRWFASRPRTPERHVHTANQLTRSLREYRIPVYTVRAHRPESVAQIFERLNGGGIRLTAAEVFEGVDRSLGGRSPLPTPSTKRERRFTHVMALLASLEQVAQEHGYALERPVKDVALGPPDGVGATIRRSALKDTIRACSVDFAGYGGADFPYGWYPQSLETRTKSGLQIVDTTPWPYRSESFWFWEVQFSGHFAQRQDIGEDFATGAGQRAKGRLSVEWALRDLVYPLLFAQNLIQKTAFTGPYQILYCWRGLLDRSLMLLDARRFGWGFERYTSTLPTWEHAITITAETQLYPLAYEAAESLFWQFGWDGVAKSHVPAFISSLLAGRWPD